MPWWWSSADLLDQMLRNDESLDLVGSLVDLRSLGIAHEALYRVVARVSRTAVDLNSISRDAHGGIGGVHLCRTARGGDRVGRSARIAEGRGTPGEQARRLDSDHGIGEQEIG